MKATPCGLVLGGDDVFVLKPQQRPSQGTLVSMVDRIPKVGRIKLDADDVRCANEASDPNSGIVAGAN